MSIVIPTYRRPEFLERAIVSALRTVPDAEVEVIVVPNGPDQSWRAVAEQWKSVSQVKWHPIDEANANKARNNGASVAAGKYIRFLDDDDFLLPAARDQLAAIDAEDADICAGNVELTASDGSLIKLIRSSEDCDFICNVLGPLRRTGLQFYVYRRNALKSFTFHESISVGQDTHWTHVLCRAKEWHSAFIDLPVCTWVQHASSQISAKLNSSDHLKLQEQMLWETIVALNNSSRLSEQRRSAAARGMWQLIHSGYFLAPSYWIRVIEKTRSIFPGTYPDISFYRWSHGKLVDPILLESLMLPKRWLNHGCRQGLVALGLKSPWQFFS